MVSLYLYIFEKKNPAVTSMPSYLDVCINIRCRPALHSQIPGESFGSLLKCCCASWSASKCFRPGFSKSNSHLSKIFNSKHASNMIHLVLIGHSSYMSIQICIMYVIYYYNHIIWACMFTCTFTCIMNL